MKRERFLALFLACIFLFGISNAEAFEKTLQLMKQDVVDSGAIQLDLEFAVGGAEVTLVQSLDEDIIAEAVVYYTEEDLEPTLTEDVENDTYVVRFRSGIITGLYPPDTEHRWEIRIGRYDMDTDLELNLGGVVAEVDLGGMPLHNLRLALGGVYLDLDVSTPTTVRVENLVVNNGGSLAFLNNIGNTDFERFVLQEGGAVTSIGFHGAYSAGEHQVRMSGGGGVIEADVPMDAGTSLLVQSVVSPVRVTGPGWTCVGCRPLNKTYITDDYDVQEVKIDIQATAAASVLTIDRN